ncbi:MAG: hypothetical protein JW812_03575 [Alphaproteobacteria bacterium]|nr:hypothetical protein [Alphaproteobacteria bacterium]MBN2779932.1 hypothetical protein [Alphaproteobacteria bacterium]
MKQENLSVLAYANGFTLWHYKDTDTLLNVTASTFFVPVYNILNVGDMIMINAGAGASETAVAFVSALSNSSVTLSTMTQ